jgi:hypothetical protein
MSSSISGVFTGLTLTAGVALVAGGSITITANVMGNQANPWQDALCASQFGAAAQKVGLPDDSKASFASSLGNGTCTATYPDGKTFTWNALNR